MDPIRQPNEIFRLSQFVKDFEREIIRHIDKFFFDKRDQSGHPVDPAILHSDENISLVIDTDMIRGIDSLLGTPGIEARELQILYHLCARRGIPKCFASGIVLMYLRYCVVNETRRTA